MSSTPRKDGDGADDSSATPFRNYVTPAGYKRLNDELQKLWTGERPKLVETLLWISCKNPTEDWI